MRTRRLAACFLIGVLAGGTLGAFPGDSVPAPVLEALERAGDHRAELQAALDRVADDERRGLEFLLAHMPEPDLRSLTADFLVENVAYAYRAWRESPWRESVPEEIFLNDVLPYANINERRDRWRKEFYERFKPLVAGARTSAEAAATLNQKIFPLLGVRYSTQRRRADQGPRETMETGLASCTGLSILLIDACRAVGVPARFVGIPRWRDGSGNHSWVEVWDGGWHFTGAAEPTGDDLDRAWFTERASQAHADDPRHAIYAVSYRKTPLPFPLVWARRVDYVSAVNVTDRYAGRSEPLPDGFVRVFLEALDGKKRCSARVEIRRADGEVVFEGETKDGRFDTNDQLTASIRKGEAHVVHVRLGEREVSTDVEVNEDSRLITVEVPPASDAPGSAPANALEPASRRAVAKLSEYLAEPRDTRGDLLELSFATVALSRAGAARAEELLRADHAAWIRSTRAAELEERTLRHGELEMRFFYEVFGEKPPNGRSLYISLHGGGNAAARVNDRQWENQKRLYRIDEGVYLAPRAPTNTWNLWHQAHIDALFDRLIEDLIVFEDVDPNRVYLLGYSAGGDGVYQLAPRMADRFAAAAMMAGHPNETVPLGLRNLPFTSHMGGRDRAYNRNAVAREWGEKLDALAASDPEGYVHWVEIYPEKGHWMGGADAAALPWMAKYARNPRPQRIVWKQDDVTHRRFYWLAVPDEATRARSLVRATRDGQRIELDAEDVDRITVRLDDSMVDLDEPVTVAAGDRVLFSGRVPRTIAVIARTLAERGDPKAVFRAEIEVDLATRDRLRSF